jgi:hypothetical protein
VISGVPHVTTPTYDGAVVDTESNQTINGTKVIGGNVRVGLLNSGTQFGVEYSSWSIGRNPNTGIVEYNNTRSDSGIYTSFLQGGTERIRLDGPGGVYVYEKLTLDTAIPIAIKSGTNQRAGNATLVAGTVTVNNTTVTANTIVLLTRKTSGGTIGTAITYTVSAGTSFTINSDSIIDTSTFSYLLIEVP